MRSAFVIFLTLIATLTMPLAAQPVQLIFDTDMGNDIDDALALAMIHALESRGEAKLLAVTLTKDNFRAAQYCDVLNHFYGRSQIPIGLVKDGRTPEDTPMVAVPVRRLDAAGAPVYPRRLLSRGHVPDAAAVLRNTLKAAEDAGVVLVQVGFSTNLLRLLDEPGGRELITAKVRLLSIMGGAFPGEPEYNIRIDIPAAKKLFQEWPTPVVASGYEIGLALEYPGASIERDFSFVPAHPVVDAYRAYKKMPYDRPTWDLTSVLYAVRPTAPYFGLSAPGKIEVLDDGVTRFTPMSGGKHRHLILRPEQKKAVIDVFTSLVSQPPKGR